MPPPPVPRYDRCPADPRSMHHLRVRHPDGPEVHFLCVLDQPQVLLRPVHPHSAPRLYPPGSTALLPVLLPHPGHSLPGRQDCVAESQEEGDQRHTGGTIAVG